MGGFPRGLIQEASRSLPPSQAVRMPRPVAPTMVPKRAVRCTHEVGGSGQAIRGRSVARWGVASGATGGRVVESTLGQVRSAGIQLAAYSVRF